ncbi:MAG: hypothetical protein U1F35_06850 [Steroidobacteraceae bacterium]
MCDVPAARIRKIANEYVDHAPVRASIEIDGRTLPFQPVAIILGETVNNGWGAFDCVWSAPCSMVLVGALEVPVGSSKYHGAHQPAARGPAPGVKPGDDGFMAHSLSPTDARGWVAQPANHNAQFAGAPLAGANGPWSELGPASRVDVARTMRREADAADLARTAGSPVGSDPAIAFWDTRHLAEQIARFPFMVTFAYTVDETNWMADLLLPEADLDPRLIRLANTRYQEQYGDHEGFVPRQPVVAARRYARLPGSPNWRGASGCWSSTTRRSTAVQAWCRCAAMDYDFLWPPTRHTRSRPSGMPNAARPAGSAVAARSWPHREHGFYVRPAAERRWYLYPTLVEQGSAIGAALPGAADAGRELERRLHERDIHWWDEQLKEYEFLPAWHDVAGRWVHALEHQGASPAGYPFWLLSTKSMQYHGGNASIELMDEVSRARSSRRDRQSRRGRTPRHQRGDMLEACVPTVGTTSGPAVLVQGIRPDTLVIIGQFDQWATPYAKDLHAPSLNTVAPMSLGSPTRRVQARMLGAGGAASGLLTNRRRPTQRSRAPGRSGSHCTSPVRHRCESAVGAVPRSLSRSCS